MPPENATVAVYTEHTRADAAIKRLQESEFDMKAVSIVGKDDRSPAQAVAYCRDGDGMKYRGRLGAFWTGIWARLPGWAFLFMPGIGPVLVAGPMSGWTMAALDNAEVFGDLSPLAAALHTIGIPRDAILAYEAAVRSGSYLVIASGASGEVSRAREIFESIGAREGRAAGA